MSRIIFTDKKNMVGNLENVGFAIEGKQCINNITVMEETVSVYACGAGSISCAWCEEDASVPATAIDGTGEKDTG